jgi:predicted transglutaminase-like cysteine proteinase
MFAFASNRPSMRQGWRSGAILAIASITALLSGAIYAWNPGEVLIDTVQSVTAPAANEPEAVSFIEDGPNTLLASSVLPTGNREQVARLFGMETEPVAEGGLPEKWWGVEAAIARDFALIAQCRSNSSCPVAVQKLIDLSNEGAGRGERARVGLINRAANLAIRPVSDQRQWGMADHWSDPIETLISGRGDCEDYAILKYAALLQAGVARDEVKIVILRSRFPDEEHAAVAIRVDAQWLILDNRTLTLVHDTDLTGAIPEFVLDHQGVRRFDRGTIFSGPAAR